MAEGNAFASDVTKLPAGFKHLRDSVLPSVIFLTVLNWPQTTGDSSPISKSNHCATLINVLALSEALNDNKAAVQKYLYIYSSDSSQVKVTGQGMMTQIQL